MKRALLLCGTAAFSFATPRGAAAQHAGPHAATIGDSVIVGQQLFARLFSGLGLDSAKAEPARHAIVRTFVDEMQFGMVLAPTTWAKVVALQDARDSTLRTFLPTDSAKTVFDERAKATRPRHHLYTWPHP